MGNFNDFFNAAPVVEQTQQQVSTEFKPNPKKGQNGVYKAIVRFLPSLTDPVNKSTIKKYTCFLTNPVTQTSKTVDCPSTVGEPDIIQNTFFALRNSSNPVLQENSKKFSRHEQYASLIQVISCDSEPALNGKILAWKYGQKIYRMIYEELHPEIGAATNPFNILGTRVFSVKVEEKAGFPNYDSCKFFDMDLKQSGLHISTVSPQGQPVSGVVTADTIASDAGKQMVFKYLQDNAPDMSKYEYQPWTTEVSEFVNQCIQIYSNPQATVQAAAAAGNAGGYKVQLRPAYQQAGIQGLTQTTAPQASNPGIQMPELNATFNSQVDPRGFNGLEMGAELPFDDGAKSVPQQSQTLDLQDILNGQIL